MRTLLTLIVALAALGLSAGSVAGVNAQHAQELLTSILQDVGAILNSFAGGPDDPGNPVSNPATLARDQSLLDAATRHAEELATELQQSFDRSAGHDDS